MFARPIHRFTFISTSQPSGANRESAASSAASAAAHCGAPGETAAAGLRNICPVCGQADCVQRLDTLYLSTSHMPDGQAEFLQRSAPPAARAMPTRRPTYGRSSLLFALGGMVLGLAVWLLSPWTATTNPLLLGAGALLAMYVGTMAGAALIMAIKRPKMSREVAAYMQRLRQFEAEAEEQQRAFLIWSQLLYCQRDEAVFLPGGKESAALQDTLAFCYRLAEQPATK